MSVRVVDAHPDVAFRPFDPMANCSRIIDEVLDVLSSRFSPDLMSLVQIPEPLKSVNGSGKGREHDADPKYEARFDGVEREGPDLRSKHAIHQHTLESLALLQLLCSAPAQQIKLAKL